MQRKVGEKLGVTGQLFVLIGPLPESLTLMLGHQLRKSGRPGEKTGISKDGTGLTFGKFKSFSFGEKGLFLGMSMPFHFPVKDMKLGLGTVEIECEFGPEIHHRSFGRMNLEADGRGEGRVPEVFLEEAPFRRVR